MILFEVFWIALLLFIVAGIFSLVALYFYKYWKILDLLEKALKKYLEEDKSK
jgi:hypothetical protein